ncbi:MAG: hypothetical protein LQ349_002026 [Xanthoria aureola]|nr:MAG: hypothetical protein LQ349_002026 [Xanthoria aureola]
MDSQTRRWALTQAKEEASVAARKIRSRSVPRFRQSSRPPPLVEGLNPPAQGAEDVPKSSTSHDPRPKPTDQAARRLPLAHTSPTETVAGILVGKWCPDPETGSLIVHRHVLEQSRRTEVSRPHQRWPRASTEASDGATWESNSIPGSNHSYGASAGYVSNRDARERLKTGWPSELQILKDCRPPETPSEDGVIQTCEPEGRDALLALKAQIQEYLSTEERRLDELIRAEDRIRELEQHNKALTVQLKEEAERQLRGAARPNKAPVPASNPTTTAGFIHVSGIDRNVGEDVNTKEIPSSA